MNSLNTVQIIGNLTRDPEVKQIRDDLSVCSFGVATNKTWNDKDGKKCEEVEFHNVIAWKKVAELCGKYLHKGSKVFIEGSLKTNTWEDKETKKKMYKTEIIANNVIFLTPKNNTQESTPEISKSNNSTAQIGIVDEISISELPF